MTDAISEFTDFMRSHGVGPHDAGDIHNDDKVRRIRLDTDKPKVMNARYCLKTDSYGFSFGWVHSFKEGVTHKFHSKSKRTFTAAEKAAHKAKAEASRAARDHAQAKEYANAAAVAARMWEKAARGGSTDYLIKKQVELNGARTMGDMVVVPLKKDGELVGLQFIKPDGSKRFNKGIAKEGAYFAIAKAKDDLSHFIICEGFATGASLRAATGTPIIVAFDAGNLKPVAQAIRRKYPEARITIAADNDQWTAYGPKSPREYGEFKDLPGDAPIWAEWREAGKLTNTGIEKAGQAAVAVGGARVVAPDIKPTDSAKRTDWNDVAVSLGLELIQEAFKAVEPGAAPDGEAEGHAGEYDGYEGYDHDAEASIGIWDGPEDPADAALAGIRPLGYNDNFYYFLPRATGQVVEVTAQALGSMQTLQRLAPKSWLARWFGGEKGQDKEITSNASSALMETCHKMGIYNPDRIRSVGAWMEGANCVFNTGTRIITNGQDIPVSQYQSRSGFLYPLSVDRVGPLPEAMSDADAVSIVYLCTSLKWADPMGGYYLAGWIVTSILGGVMRWRPHIYLTGDRGAGKSTVLDDLVKRLLGGLPVEADGGSTEAGIRREILNSSVPVIMDESEGNNRMDRDKIAAVMSLMRASSSGGVMLNAIDKYKCRASFLMAGINPQIRTEADKSRMAVIHLRADSGPGAQERYAKWQERLAYVTRSGASGRLVARLIECSADLPGTLKVMGAAIRDIGSSARFADQHAALLSGVWLLVKKRVPTQEEAAAFLEKIGMNVEQQFDHDDTGGESVKVLTEIMTSDHRYDQGGMPRSSTIAAMVEMAMETDGVGQQAAIAGLSGLGIEVDGDYLRIASTSPRLSKILRDTPWAGEGWSRHLMSIHGAREGKKRAFLGMQRRRTVEVPLGLALGYNDMPEPELPFGDPNNWDDAPIYGGDDFK